MSASGLGALLLPGVTPSNPGGANSGGMLFGTVIDDVPLLVMIDGATTSVTAVCPPAHVPGVYTGARVLGMRVGSSFYILATLSPTPVGHLRRTAGSVTFGASTEQSMVWDTTEVLDGGFTTANGLSELVVPVSGRYQLAGGLQTATVATRRQYLTFGISNTTMSSGVSAFDTNNDALNDTTVGSTAPLGTTISITRSLNAGDHVALRHWSTIAESWAGFAFLQVTRVG